MREVTPKCAQPTPKPNCEIPIHSNPNCTFHYIQTLMMLLTRFNVFEANEKIQSGLINEND